MIRSNTDVPEPVTRENQCQVVEVLDHVAGKWSIGIMVALAAGPIRFTELERAVPGISRRMLTLNLRRLERDGLLVRTIYPTVPPRVEYALTDIARELNCSLTAVVRWAELYRTTIDAAREAYDAAQAAETEAGTNAGVRVHA
ncbi:helix-turn-helix domain-containing protein [Streptomyces sp. SID3343]|uniref:winged helix-turn-helix transcriptional regulator n=1 Tax=Streptomyces sp. SID3343 TaxID=2690260 RepID=UPI0013684CA4|nr:helix-turn-helix domain-containing protein [Streptomyces sp. SID3343]MYV98282.1 transcriptional regulator [Streptomyces sp. SID3343]